MEDSPISLASPHSPLQHQLARHLRGTPFLCPDYLLAPPRAPTILFQAVVVTEPHERHAQGITSR